MLFAQRFRVFSVLFLAAVVLSIYASSFSTGFFADDYNFLRPAAQLDLPQYLAHYFDPRVQVLWYRPLQGMLVLVEWWLFGADATGYHVVQILIHIVNCLLLWALVARVSKQEHLGFLAAMFYATFPVYALAINWINIPDPIMTLFYLSGVWFWLNYLNHPTPRDYVYTMVMFVIALLLKQMALTLPAILFLIDLLILGNKRDLLAWIRRYLAFSLVVLIFIGIQYLTRSTHTFAGVFGYALGPHILSVTVQYLSLLAFPWGYYPASDTQIVDQLPDFIPIANVVWMVLAVGLYLFWIYRTRSRALVFLGASVFITLLPVLPFPFIELRYLYLPAMFPGILLALLFEHMRTGLNHPRWFAAFSSLIITLFIVGNQYAVATANAGIYEIARQRRVPFRDISRAHPTFPDDTHLYFIDPVSPISELAGMFTLRYGRGVTVAANEFWRDPIARLREHKHAFVYYFDETGKPIEVPVEPKIAARPSLSLPLDYSVPIRLEGYELARASLRRGDALVAIFYWRAMDRIDQNYTVFVHLVDQHGQMLAGYDSEPRKGDAPTSKWLPNRLIVDAIVLPIPAETPLGNDYRLEVGMYYLPTMQRLVFVDPRGQPLADALIVAPLSVVE